VPRPIALTLIFALATLPAAAQRASILSAHHSPVSLDQAEFAPDGVLRSADISNASGQTIIAVQFGCFIRHIDGKITTVVGKNNSIRGGMQPGDRLVFGRQLMTGTIDDAIELYYFVSRVTYEDGTSWNAPLEALRHQIYRKNNTKKRPLTPA
jgi:hypothetical protein